MTPAIDPAFIATAAEVVLRAGDTQLAHFGAGVAVTKKGPIDLVTEVDLEIERMLRRLIGERFPTHAILAEELPNDPVADGAAGYRWVFDPIDGTVNYAHGLPFFCASLALEIDGVPSVGAVYDPVRQELYAAERGMGARLNGAPLHVSTADALTDALLCTGFPYDIREHVDEAMALFGAFVGGARAVRRFGSAALDLCYVAAGRLDGFWERGLHPWDTAAAALIVDEAGGQVSGMRGEPFQTQAGNIVASNGRIHEAMLATIGACESRSRNGTD